MEAEIVDALLPHLKRETPGIGFVPKQTDAGEKSGFRAVLAVGNNNVYLGVSDEGTHTEPLPTQTG